MEDKRALICHLLHFVAKGQRYENTCISLSGLYIPVFPDYQDPLARAQ